MRLAPLCVLLAALAGTACSSVCDHATFCDGNTLVGCAEREEDSARYEYRRSCEANTCVRPEGVADAFCSWSPVPLPACAGPVGASLAACDANRAIYCLGGYPVEMPPEVCAADETCIACAATDPVRDFAGCGLGAAAEPRCTAATRSACDDSVGARFDCTCGWRSYQAGCARHCASAENAGTSYGLCTLATGRDARCGPANDAGDSGYCYGDVLTECFLGFPVRLVTCQPGQCFAANGPLLAGCNGAPLAEEGVVRGGVAGL